MTDARIGEMNGIFEMEELKMKVEDLKKRGFQEWPEWIGLSKTVFTKEAKFETVDDKFAEAEEKKVINEVEKQTGSKWSVVSIVEVGEQKQKRLRVFLREKYGKIALEELVFDLEKINESLNEGRGIGVLREMVIPSLRVGDWHTARIDCEQQRDKLEYPDSLVRLLKEGLYSEGEKTPWDRFVAYDD